MTGNADSFGAQAKTYVAARPTYPADLFDWIARTAPDLGLVWDVGTGSGQAAASLAARFRAVRATDADSAQIAAAPPCSNVTYEVAPAHISNLPNSSVDAVTVGTALHWFDFERFWPEVRRVCRPNALFTAWSYVWAEADEDVRRLLIDPQMAVIVSYWSDRNKLSWEGYPPEQTQCPFEQIDVPAFACTLRWRPCDLAAFIRSWSAHYRARQDGHAEALGRIEAEALARLPDEVGTVRLPLVTFAARID